MPDALDDMYPGYRQHQILLAAALTPFLLIGAALIALPLFQAGGPVFVITTEIVGWAWTGAMLRALTSPARRMRRVRWLLGNVTPAHMEARFTEEEWDEQVRLVVNLSQPAQAGGAPDHGYDVVRPRWPWQPLLTAPHAEPVEVYVDPRKGAVVVIKTPPGLLLATGRIGFAANGRTRVRRSL